MVISEQRNGVVVLLGPVGRIDNLTAAPAFQDQAPRLGRACRCRAVFVVDLTERRRISPAPGLRALMVGVEAVESQPRDSWRIAALGPVVQEIFTISRFALVVQVFNTPGEAIEALRA